MTDEELNAIEARANAATPGPWVNAGGGVSEPDGMYWVAIVEHEDVGYPNGTERDTEFIAHARTDVPALVAEVRRLRAELGLIDEWQRLQQDRASAQREASPGIVLDEDC